MHRLFDQTVSGVVRGPDVKHFALTDEVVERAQRLFLGRFDVLHVDLVKVDAVGLQPPQAVLGAAHDASSGGPGAERAGGPRRKPNFVASTTSSRPTGQGLLAAGRLRTTCR